MDNNLINICYRGEQGDSDIRTCHHNGILYVSLNDIFSTLHRENEILNENRANASVADLILGQVADLDPEEQIRIPVPNPDHLDHSEVFITQPGLYRVMSGNKSKAGRKFQKWLFHEVIPSITKYGCYPPPVTPQGSALSQMAEILAQNSRALADAIIRQDQLESKVNNVEQVLGQVVSRVTLIESDGIDTDFIVTVKERADQLFLQISKDKETEIVAWCENLNLRKGRRKINCPTGVRTNTRFEIEVIDEAISLVSRANS